jgi:hypothetical protein
LTTLTPRRFIPVAFDRAVNLNRVFLPLLTISGTR